MNRHNIENCSQKPSFQTIVLRMVRQKRMIAESLAQFAQRKKKLVSLRAASDDWEVSRAAHFASRSNPMQRATKEVTRRWLGRRLPSRATMKIFHRFEALGYDALSVLEFQFMVAGEVMPRIWYFDGQALLGVRMRKFWMHLHKTWYDTVCKLVILSLSCFYMRDTDRIRSRKLSLK